MAPSDANAPRSSAPRSSEPTQPTPRRGRPPKGVPLLTTETIAIAALDEIDAEGLDSLTIRSVARRLSVDPKSLYNHVEGKDGLLDAVADHVLAGVVLPAPSGDLAADIKAFAQAFRAHALCHPQAASLVMTRQTGTVASLAPIEAVLAMLVAAGCSPAHAVQLLRMFMSMLIGAVLREAGAAPMLGNHDSVEAARREELLLASGLPMLSAAAPFIATFEPDAEFAFAVEKITEAVLGDIARRPAAT